MRYNTMSMFIPYAKPYSLQTPSIPLSGRVHSDTFPIFLVCCCGGQKWTCVALHCIAFVSYCCIFLVWSPLSDFCLTWVSLCLCYDCWWKSLCHAMTTFGVWCPRSGWKVDLRKCVSVSTTSNGLMWHQVYQWTGCQRQRTSCSLGSLKPATNYIEQHCLWLHTSKRIQGCNYMYHMGRYTGQLPHHFSIIMNFVHVIIISNCGIYIEWAAVVTELKDHGACIIIANTDTGWEGI